MKYAGQILFFILGFTPLCFSQYDIDPVPPGHRDVSTDSRTAITDQFYDSEADRRNMLFLARNALNPDVSVFSRSGTIRGPTWWSVDLGMVYQIARVTIVASSDLENQQYLTDLVISFSNHSNVPDSPGQIICVESTGTRPLTVFPVNCIEYAQIVLIWKREISARAPAASRVVELGYVRIEALCDDFQWGQDCLQRCSTHCRAPAIGGPVEPCNKYEGTCIRGCEDGYLPPVCEEVCPAGMYGDQCAFSCINCVNYNCSEIGICLEGCNPGLSGIRCDEACPDRTTGLNCAFDCPENCNMDGTCHPTTGECDTGCISGYYGPECLDVCPNGTYADNCTMNCSITCKDMFCDKFDDLGGCLSGCVPGYEGHACGDLCSVGTYGENCAEDCDPRCAGSQCDPFNGSCIHGCANGWIGDPECNIQCEPGMWGFECRRTCNSNCKNTSLCHHATGFCSPCLSGYHGPKCDIKSARIDGISEGAQTTLIFGFSFAFGIGLILSLCLISYWRWCDTKTDDTNLRPNHLVEGSSEESFRFYDDRMSTGYLSDTTNKSDTSVLTYREELMDMMEKFKQETAATRKANDALGAGSAVDADAGVM